MLPRSIEQLTADWLQSVLAERFPGTRVKTLTVRNVIWGTATKVLVEADYFEPPGAGDPPTALCVKGEFDERTRKALLEHLTISPTQMEARFYADIAPLLTIPLARHWFAGHESGMGIIVMDDLTDATFGRPACPWAPELVALALNTLALLHASTWNRKFPKSSWLGVGSAMTRQGYDMLMSAPHWAAQFATPGAFQLPMALKNRERNLRALHALWRHLDSVATCLVHGDAHLVNTCVDSTGQPLFLDWATPNISCWASDVAYFMAGAMTIADRRANERDLLHRYLSRLKKHGGPVLDPADAWAEYRRNHLTGLIWTTLPSAMQPSESVHLMGERYVAAIIDHDTLGALGE